MEIKLQKPAPLHSFDLDQVFGHGRNVERFCFAANLINHDAEIIAYFLLSAQFIEIPARRVQ